MPELTRDQQLAADAAKGDQSAFRELYRAHVRGVYWVAYGILGAATDAEDVTQETFIVAWRKLPGLKLAGESLLPWLVTICRFQSANRLRQLRRDRANTSELPDENVRDTVDVEDQVISAELAELILAELETLGELDREIFRLCATEGYAYQAAAEQLGTSRSVVRNRLSRVRTRLKGALSETSEA
jgi:RNA polymerase sigma factor (sigma-70 family)